MPAKILITLLPAFLFSLIACPLFIKHMKKLQFGQQIREDGPERHSIKAGTPTMGGLVILFSAVIVSAFTTALALPFLIILPVLLGCGLLGFIDDYLKIVKKQSLGLKARSKLTGMAIITLLFLLLLKLTGFYSTSISLPLINQNLNLGYLYPVFVLLLITGFSNSVNLTDGLDGLAAGTSVLALTSLAGIGLMSDYSSIAIFCAALVGALLGFLVFNRYPAKLFMGDVGSLAIGGTLAAAAVLTKVELLLLIIGAVFVLEAFSVTLQVLFFQLFGKRILLMSPLHHHYELKGWSEWKVVSIFWLAALIFAVIGLWQYSLMPEVV
jgi:phospho-N-acetylmuramoyl-pentapeptide-transferase